MALSRVHYPVTVLGPGRRAGIWTQGCSIGCKGCASKDTWAKETGGLVEIEALVGWCREVALEGLDGVTISGGEPFEQSVALRELLQGLSDWRERERLDFDLLCYSGFPLKRLRTLHPEILALLDVVIPEPYVQERTRGTTWQGSCNQPLVTLSPRGVRRYTPYLTGETAVDQRLQFQVDDDNIWIIGVPDRGDLERLAIMCRERGLAFDDTSWQS